MEDRYEKVLLNLISHHEKEIEQRKKRIERLKLRDSSHPEWRDTNLNTIEVNEKINLKVQTKIDTIWVCLNHYRSLLGVNNARTPQ